MRLFLSYRRDDSADITGRLHDRLAAHFGRESVFIDVDSVPLGVDFRDHLDRWIASCDAVLVIIGNAWLSSRLDDPSDFVRIEVAAALARGIPVVPVLVGETAMPTAAALPAPLAALAYRNAAELRSGRDFHDHAQRLIDGIEKVLVLAPAIEPRTQPQRARQPRIETVGEMSMLGAVIDGYEIRAKCGEGPFGEVWTAESEVPPHDDVVIKVFHREVSGDHAMAACVDEARLLKDLRLSNVAQVLTVGRLEDGRAYVVRDHVDGESLASPSKAFRHSTTLVADIIEQAANILITAANAGILHNDLKPTNIFLVKDRDRPSGERVVITDFGQGRLVAAMPSKAAAGYLAPEQDQGYEASWRIDTYALGCIAFELTTLRALFTATSWLDLHNLHKRKIPPNVRAFVPDVSASFDRLIARMLEKTPSDRPKRMRDVGKLFELMMGVAVPIPSTAPDPAIRFPDITQTEPSVEQVVSLRLGERHENESKAEQVLREGSRTAIEADRAERPEDAHKLRLFAALQLIQAVEIALYRRITRAFPPEVRKHWVEIRRREAVDVATSVERAVQLFLEKGQQPSLTLLGRMLKPPGPCPAELANTLRGACRVDERLRSRLFDLGAIRDVLAHLPDYEEDASRSVEGPHGLFVEDVHGDGTRKLVIDPAYLVSLEQVCHTLVADPAAIVDPPPLPEVD